MGRSEGRGLQVLIVDDEPIARRGLRKLIAAREAVVVGECGDGSEAVREIRRLRPDLVVLDVQMPELDGFEVVRRVGIDEMPPVLFVTAYDEYAVDAFDVHAVDYVLKPVDPERFHQAYDRAVDRVWGPAAGLRGRVEAVLAALEESEREPEFVERLAIKDTERIFFVEVDDIDWIEAAGNYVKLHVADRAYLRRDTLTGLAERLDPTAFLRVGRSAIVNLGAIRDLAPLFKGSYAIRLRGGAEVTSSRRFRDAIASLIDGH